MKIEDKYEKAYKNRMKRVYRIAIVQIIFAISIVISAVVSTWMRLYSDARKTSTNATTRTEDIIEGYEGSFRGILIPIKDKIAEKPSFGEMQSWLQSKEEEFREAVGEDAYDGIALTYQDGYAHSWDYGDYTDYDPNTRSWYQQAQAADGEITVVAPYVTYLSAADQKVETAVLMTIAQKYTDEISFDLDLKLPKIKEILQDVKTLYPNEKIFIYNSEGQILSSTLEDVFAHNIYEADEVISEDIANTVKGKEGKPEAIQLEVVDGRLYCLYFSTNDANSTICIMIPAVEIFWNDFFLVLLICGALIGYVIYIFIQNRRNAAEFVEKDHRLEVIENAEQRERLYVDVDQMTFSDNEMARENAESATYEALYQLIRSRMADQTELPRLEAFLAPEVVRKCVDRQYVIDKERFLMTMQEKDGTMKQKTIEMRRFAFIQNRKNMLEIAMLDAAESVDLLKAALNETERVKRALEDAYKLAVQGSQAKGSFLSNMSHEIRTPLNAIIGYLTIAADQDCTEEKKDYCIDNCQTASKHLLQIINDILDMSSIENGKLKIAHEEFDLKKELEDITSIFYQNAKIKKVHFETRIENVTEEWVVGDQLRLNQVLMNLLSNAVKFTAAGGLVVLKVEQLRKDRQKVYMKFTVKDTGIGMSEEYMSRIFHPFEQENAGTAKKFGGSGLGLSITSNLVQMMGGKIDVQSVQHEGTAFEVTMFFSLAEKEHANKVSADYSHVRVLIVDDKADECSYVKMMLKRCGVKADSVTSGSAALKRIRSRKGGDYAYDLCIIDWNMPEMDGCEVTSKIRLELGEKMPIIIATAYDVTEFEEKAKQAGADRVVAKPLFQSTLFDILVSSFGNYDPKEGQTEEKKMDLTGIHVLLAEDNPMNMDIAVTIMEKTGVQVDQAHDGSEAVEKFLSAQAGTYDLILMDVQMPVMDGYEATTKIRASSHPEAKTIPIIAMTANAFAEDVAQALSKGMNAHISKPIRYDKLFELLKKYGK